jgi:hypothetical protein
MTKLVPNRQLRSPQGKYRDLVLLDRCSYDTDILEIVMAARYPSLLPADF